MDEMCFAYLMREAFRTSVRHWPQYPVCSKISIYEALLASLVLRLNAHLYEEVLLVPTGW